MPKRLQIAPHLPVAELERRYRQASEGIERSHYQIIWLLAQGRKSEDVATLTSYSRLWIYELVRSYNRCGPDALGDKRRENPGKSPLLNDVQQAQLWQALQDSPTDGDLWDGPKVAQWMSSVLGRKIHPQRGWEYLKNLEMRRRRPRPAHIESDEAAQREWKKNFPQTVAALRSTYPDAKVSVWAEDEHRIGLQPVNRMVWVPRGETPIASVNLKYEWLWLIGFVEPASGETYWWIVPRLNWQILERVLADFAQAFQVSATNRILLVLDQASFHTTRKLKVPEGLHLLFLPPKSPELQPAERLWPLTNEAIANRSFESLDELETLTAHRCRVLMHQRDFVRGVTGYYWWLEAVS
jgi:transposase